MSAPTNDALIGSTVGGCLIMEVIGQGGMGVIYKARQKSLDRIVALKVLAPHLANDINFVTRFQREARSIARVNHPNILAVYDVGDDQNVNYMIMELIDGASLAEVQTERRGAIPWEESANFVKQAAQGLEAAQAAGIIHRDIKPENLMVTKKGVIKVSDFGLAKESDASNTSIDAVMGTPAFMSPEQCDGKKVDGRSDIYSLGGTFYRLITGRLPFEAETAMSMMYRHKHEALIPPHEVVHALPVSISQVICKMMAKKREQRYQTMTEVIDAIDAALKPAPVVAKPAASPAPAARIMPVPVPAPADDPIALPPAQEFRETGIMRRDSLSGIQLRSPGASAGRIPVPPAGNVGFGNADSSGRLMPPSGLMAPPGVNVPDDAYTNVARGDEMLGRGDRVNALKAYRQALAGNTLDAATRERIEAEIAKEAASRRQAADSLIKRGMLVEASRECRILVEIDPHDESAKTLLKEIEAKLSTRRTVENDIRTALAAGEFEKAIKIWDSTPSELRSDALLRQIEQLRNKVVPSLKLAQQGDNFSKQGRLEEAISSYEDALKINEMCEPARMGLKDTQQKVQRIEFMLKEGYQYALEQNFVKAVETLKPILGLRPGHPQAVKSIVDACIAHAQMLRAQGDVEGAWAAYKTAIEVDNGNKNLRRTYDELTNLRDKEQALMDRAHDAAARGHLSEAIGYLKEVQRNNPANKKAAQLIAQYSKQRSGILAKIMIILIIVGLLGAAGFQFYQESESLKGSREKLQGLRDAETLDAAHTLMKESDLTGMLNTIKSQMFIFNGAEARQAKEELAQWAAINQGMDLMKDGKLADAQRIFLEQSKQTKERPLQQKLSLQAKHLQLTQLENEALAAVKSLKWKNALENYSEIKSHIEEGEVPEAWKKTESDVQDKLILLQKVQKGEGYERDKNNRGASKEYRDAQKLQSRHKLPALDEWLASRLKEVGIDEAALEADLKTAKDKLRLSRNWKEADALLKKAQAVYSTTEIEALLKLTADGMACDEKDMSLIVRLNSTLNTGTYQRAAAFCIDRYEFPNKAGTAPTANLSLVQARDECVKVGKKLCTFDNWKTACMGEENQGWPYGNRPDDGLCNTGGKAAVASGSKAGCKTASGVYDMSGNLAEWTDDNNAAVSGGSYEEASGRAGCMDAVPPGGQTAANVGFRCCLSVTAKDKKDK